MSNKLPPDIDWSAAELSMLLQPLQAAPPPQDELSMSHTHRPATVNYSPGLSSLSPTSSLPAAGEGHSTMQYPSAVSQISEIHER